MDAKDVIERLNISFNVSSVISYANYYNQVACRPIFFSIRNTSKSVIDDISIILKSNNKLLLETVVGPFSIEAENEVTPKYLAFKWNEEYLTSITESEKCVIELKVLYKDEEIYKEERATEITTIDYWKSNVVVSNEDGEPICCSPPELKSLLSSFVTPNHPIIKEIAINSTNWLNKWTNDPSLDGYQSKDPNRIKQMVAAVYAAIQQMNIVYSEPPTSFGLGQRIRMCFDIKEQRIGTCLDLTLLFASVLESIGLYPILILHEQHIYCGCWLVQDGFKDGVIEDFTQVTKRIVKGVNEIIIFECTAVCAGKSVEFDDAVKVAEHKINEDDFEAAIDIHTLRTMYGYRPLPLIIKNGDKIEIQHEDRKDEEITSKANELNDIDLSDIKKTEVNKVQYWERKLLDLSTRNSLINTRFKNVIPIIISSLADIEDKLNDGEEFGVETFKIEDADEVSIEYLEDLAKNAQFIKEASNRKSVFTYGNEKPINTALTKIYRTAKTSIEESGSSTLYLATGFLRWYQGSLARYAPLFLIPIELNRSASKGFSIRKRDEDVEFNITLLEMLKEEFGIEVNGLDDLPKDAHGIDVDKACLILRKAIMAKSGWEIVEIAAIGNFSFTQFVMWNDLHRSIDKLSRNKVVSSLIDGAVNFDTTIPKDVDSGDTYLPISVDESQLHAIKMAEKGCTFVLHGPPGTGKSQTITAMIANAMAKGKTVLFVAEKMAALEVVDNRLSNLGLEPFCLELHSNKSSKKNVLEQLDAGLNLKYKGIKSDYYNLTLDDLKKRRLELDAYSKELHKKLTCGYSLRELIDAYDEMEGEEIRTEYANVSSLDNQELLKQKKLIESLFSAGKEIKGYDKESLDHFDMKEFSLSAQYEIEDTLKNYVRVLDEIKTNGIDIDNYKPEVIKDDDDLYIEEIENKWNDDFLSLNMDSFTERLNAAKKKILFKNKEIETFKNEIKLYLKNDTAFEIDTIFEDIKKYQTLKEISKTKEVRYVQDDNYAIMQKLSEIENKLESQGVLINKLSNANLDENKVIANKLSNILNQLRDYILYKNVRSECLANKLDEVVLEYENDKDTNLIMNAYIKGLYKALIVGTILNNDVLNKFAGSSFNEKIRQFKELDEEFCEATKDEIYYILAHKLPAKYESTEVNKELTILKKAIASKGRGYSIRNLFAEIPNVLTRICPCVMMSPMSVAQYLSPDMPPFDMVIFDEASQLPTCKAVGVLARGTSSIIVGDPKQMPPTAFFTGNYVDEDNITMEDLDSILDDCLALGLPETYLQWHYRSRHESLIAFSNREFYENKMLTFPSVNDQEKRVKYVKVHGFYDQKTGTNEAEAKSIIAEIKRRYNNPKLKDKSIGVVTFNIKQQNYIEDLLLEECKNDLEFDKWVNKPNDSLFVKNLENVQGDERDVILFSILFGPNKNNKLSLNFGPINKEGGWKRLNVAASRAKQEMILFSIMSYDMIDLSRSNSIGVSSLRDFLEFAERGKLQRIYSEIDKKQLGISDRIVKALSDAGYVCKKNIGNSEFKIDIAIVNPYDEETYLLGIMLDGDVYGQTQNTRDREIAQVNVLSMLGWNIKRVWAMDFWTDEKKEISKLLDELSILKEKAKDKVIEKDNDEIAKVDIDYEIEDIDETKKKTSRTRRTVRIAQKTLKSKDSETVLTSSKIVGETKSNKYEFRKYEYADLKKIVIDQVELFEESSQKILNARIKEIIQREAPLKYDNLVSKLLESISIDNKSSLVKAAFDQAFNSVDCIKENEENSVWIWNNDPSQYHIYRFANKRDLNDICNKELANAVCLAIQDKGNINKETLTDETMKNLGYASLSADVNETIGKAIGYAINNNLVVLTDGIYSLKK